VSDKVTDRDLVHDVRTSGSRDAANQLVIRHLRSARVAALVITRDTDAADDICQDAFVYAIAHIEDCRDANRFGAWLRQIVRSHARNHIRRERVRRTEPLVDTEPSTSESPLRSAERAEESRRILDGLGELSDERREVLLLHDLEGWTHAEIAARMELPEGTVRSHLHFARRAMRQRLSELRGEHTNG
jgi:RNA polymerase sigma-70 factor (ECF subfamily)